MMKYIPGVIAAFLLTACSAQKNLAGKSSAQLCEQTVLDYAVLRDEGPAADYADLFTPDGTFILGENMTQGRAALAARHQASNKAALWRHNMLDIRISGSDAALTGKSRFIIYTAAHPAPAKSPREIVGHYADKFVIKDGRCLISSRQVHVLFDSE